MANGVGTTHHIKLGTQFCIVRPNTYAKMPAPTFGARISTGDPNYNNLSIWQHWVQHCWVGGQGADAWVDDAMFKDAVGLDTTQHEQATLARHLKRGTGANWAAGTATDVRQGQFMAYNGILYCLVPVDDPADVADSRLYSYNPTTQAWTAITMPGASFYCRSLAIYDGKLFVGGSQTSGTDVPALYWASAAVNVAIATNVAWKSIAAPAGMPMNPVTAMRTYNQKLYVCWGVHVWRMKNTFDKAGATAADIWDGGTEFYAANVGGLSNGIVALETHLGFLYLLSDNGHLHRTDGNNTFDIWSWDGQTKGVSLRSYDGKLFVGTFEYTEADGTGFGVLYQFTGAAVTELKRWGRAGRATTIGQMTVYGRRLFYGASGLFGVRPGFGIACYDSVEDGHSIFAINDDVTTYPDSTGYGGAWQVDDVIVFGGKMFCFVRGWGIFFTEDSFKDVEQNRASFTSSTQGGTITSSLYDGGTPGLQKLWRRVTVWADIPVSTSMTVSYSLDNGVTWVAFPVVNGPTATDMNDFYLNNIRDSSFMWRVTFKTTDTTKTPILRSVAVAYLPQPEPNWMWTFVIPVTDKWELIDKTIAANDTNALLAYVENLYRTQQLFTFIDIDGVAWATNGPGVILYDMNIMHYDVEQPREADLRITLLEVIESY